MTQFSPTVLPSNKINPGRLHQIQGHLVKMSKPKVLLLGKIVQCVPLFYSAHAVPLSNNRSAHSTWNSLSSIAELVTPAATNRADFIAECKSGKLDGVVVAYRTFDSVTQTGLFDEELVNILPASMKYLAHCGTLSSYPTNMHQLDKVN